MINFKSIVLRFCDRLMRKRDFKRIQKFKSNYKYIERLAICGGGHSLKFISSIDSSNCLIASCNYTRLSQFDVKPDVIMLSDPALFNKRLLDDTVAHIKSEAPQYILVPTRVRLLPLVAWKLRSFEKVYVKFYGPKLWEQSSPFLLKNLSQILPRFDSVAFEFGYPLAFTLNVKSVHLFGIDLTYGKSEDESEFRIAWRNRIKRSLNNCSNRVPFSVFKFDGSRFSAEHIE